VCVCVCVCVWIRRCFGVCGDIKVVGLFVGGVRVEHEHARVCGIYFFVCRWIGMGIEIF
jgi:hypothetical protein